MKTTKILAFATTNMKLTWGVEVKKRKELTKELTTIFKTI